jgi:hypothetical protein
VEEMVWSKDGCRKRNIREKEEKKIRKLTYKIILFCASSSEIGLER